MSLINASVYKEKSLKRSVIVLRLNNPGESDQVVMKRNAPLIQLRLNGLEVQPTHLRFEPRGEKVNTDAT